MAVKDRLLLQRGRLGRCQCGTRLLDERATRLDFRFSDRARARHPFCLVEAASRVSERRLCLLPVGLAAQDFEARELGIELNEDVARGDTVSRVHPHGGNESAHGRRQRSVLRRGHRPADAYRANDGPLRYPGDIDRRRIGGTRRHHGRRREYQGGELHV